MTLRKKKTYLWLSGAVLAWMSAMGGHVVLADGPSAVYVTANQAQALAKYESQATSVISAKDIQDVQAKSAEDIVFKETGVSRSVDRMGRVGVSIRGAEPRHTLVLVDGQPVIGEFAKYAGGGDELMRLGAENLDRIEIVRGAASAKYGSGAIGGVINVITKQPLKTPMLQFNGEGKQAVGDTGLWPYSNFYLRADSGQMGNVRVALWGNKKMVMPVYASEERKEAGFVRWDNLDHFEKNSLRYYGDSSNLGVSAVVDMNKNQSLQVRGERYNEELGRFVKHTTNYEEPGVSFKRKVTRNTWDAKWKQEVNEKTSIEAGINYTTVKENDLSLTTDTGRSAYEGSNVIRYIDNVDHKRLNVKVTADTQVNDKHLLSYGVEYNNESGEGSRLKNAPSVKTIPINPWDYDKSLKTEKDKNGKLFVATKVHDYKFSYEDGVPVWDRYQEWYNYTPGTDTVMPAFTYEDYVRTGLEYKYYVSDGNFTGNDLAHVKQMGDQLAKDNPEIIATMGGQLTEDSKQNLIKNYYSGELYYTFDNGKPFSKPVVLNGKGYKENYLERDNRLSIGKASIKRMNFFVSDSWQVNDDLLFTPSLRVDHSSLFGTNPTFNLGMTYNVNHNPNQRLKANIGTGYNEPGLGELYYNWEMYSGTPVSYGVGRMGWYWAGNKYLKPEHSVNMDIGIEGESGKTTYRATVFHNVIRDYMSIYFTGREMDFYPERNDPNSIAAALRWYYTPDLEYSFTNIGKATITGLELDLKHQFTDKWSGRLGYTLLRAINHSNANLPRHLLDKPQHKVDLTISYRNKDWFASLNGSYYIHMLDSNELTGKGNLIESDYDVDTNTGYIERYYDKQTYKKKTYGLWNFMVQRQINKDSLVYMGIDNLFNHRDDARALQGRVYRFGVNLKVGSDGLPHQVVRDASGKEIDLGPVTLEGFFAKSVRAEALKTPSFYGSYRLAHNIHGGTNRPDMRITEMGSVGDAAKNMLDRNETGWTQKLTVGTHIPVGDTSFVTVEGSAVSDAGTDTSYDVGTTGGLSHGRLEEASVTKQAKAWDVSLGKVRDTLGVMGYWFNGAFTGAKVQHHTPRTEITVGVGDFRQATGITDSAYTRAAYQAFMRPPTAREVTGEYLKNAVPDSPYLNFKKQMEDAKGSLEKERDIVTRYLDVAKAAYPNEVPGVAKRTSLYMDLPTFEGKYSYDTTDKNGVVAHKEKDGEFYSQYSASEFARKAFRVGDLMPLQENPKQVVSDWVDTHYDEIVHAYDDSIKGMERDNYFAYPSTNSKVENADELRHQYTDKAFLKDKIYELNYGTPQNNMYERYANLVKYIIEDGQESSKGPREFLGKVTGVYLPGEGIVLNRDNVPSLHRAVYVQAKHAVTPRFGIGAWYLRSLRDAGASYLQANGATTNQVDTFHQYANVFAVGAQYQLGHFAKIRGEYGKNLSPLGKYLNGATTYTFTSDGTAASITGHDTGKAPTFYSLRLDVGDLDINKEGSWSAFVDYKYFEHGSFFGGNGTASLPDRYLDGIRSFTIGGGYVPAKQLSLQAFYTFGAKGIGKRDTLFGAESFSLGNYTRVQATYHF